MEKVKAGYAAIVGLPNAGKSTLMNALLGQKISITTDKPQTTRKRILGILSEENYQIIFLDTPGILKPHYLLQKRMMDFVEYSLKDADVIVMIVDIYDDKFGEKFLSNEFVSEFLQKSSAPKILLLNKVDLSNEQHISSLIKKLEDSSRFNKIIPISATLSFNIIAVKEAIIELLPEGNKFYPDDIVADENERFFVSEIIREKIFELYQEEIPYSTEVIIQDFKEREKGKDLIQAEIIVEKDSQKGIIIGKDGSAIKKLGKIAREDIESFLDREVFLDLRVKVRKNWRGDEKMLKFFGYKRDND
jgi:GTPase